jgi:hypothetical protein
MTESSALNDGTIQFIQDWRPPLMASEYTVTIMQHLKNTDETNKNTDETNKDAAFDESYVNVKTFAVRGERPLAVPPSWY